MSSEPRPRTLLGGSEDPTEVEALARSGDPSPRVTTLERGKIEVVLTRASPFDPVALASSARGAGASPS